MQGVDPYVRKETVIIYHFPVNRNSKTEDACGKASINSEEAMPSMNVRHIERKKWESTAVHEITDTGYGNSAMINRSFSPDDDQDKTAMMRSIRNPAFLIRLHIDYDKGGPSVDPREYISRDKRRPALCHHGQTLQEVGATAIPTIPDN